MPLNIEKHKMFVFTVSFNQINRGNQIFNINNVRFL